MEISSRSAWPVATSAVATSLVPTRQRLTPVAPDAPYPIPPNPIHDGQLYTGRQAQIQCERYPVGFRRLRMPRKSLVTVAGRLSTRMTLLMCVHDVAATKTTPSDELALRTPTVTSGRHVARLCLGHAVANCDERAHAVASLGRDMVLDGLFGGSHSSGGKLCHADDPLTETRVARCCVVRDVQPPANIVKDVASGPRTLQRSILETTRDLGRRVSLRGPTVPTRGRPTMRPLSATPPSRNPTGLLLLFLPLACVWAQPFR